MSQDIRDCGSFSYCLHYPSKGGTPSLIIGDTKDEVEERRSQLIAILALGRVTNPPDAHCMTHDEAGTLVAIPDPDLCTEAQRLDVFRLFQAQAAYAS